MEANTIMTWGKKPCCSGCAAKPQALAAGGPVNKTVVTDDIRHRAFGMFSKGGEAATDTGAADPMYTTIYPGSEQSTLGTIGGMLWRPFLRREILKEEETKQVAEDTLRINPETGMPERMSTIETIPGEYGPIELSDFPTTMEIMAYGVENFFKAKEFLSTPEGREQALDIAQQLPSQAIEGATDYMTQQVDMANRGLQETYDPQTGEKKNFDIPLIAAEIMAGSLSRPAVQLADNELLTGMAVKSKGGVFERGDRSQLDSTLDDYREKLQDAGFSSEQADVVARSADTFFTRDFGTAQDPLKKLLEEGRINPVISTNRFGNLSDLANKNLQLRGYVGAEALRDRNTMETMNALQQDLDILGERRAPEGELVETGGFESFVDWEEFKQLRNGLDSLIQKTGSRPTLQSPTDAMQDFESSYDQATGLRAVVRPNLPSSITKAEWELEQKNGLQNNREWARQAQQKFALDMGEGIQREQGFKSFSSDDVIRVQSDYYDSSSPYVRFSNDTPPSAEAGSPMEFALKNEEPLWTVDPFEWKYRGLNFLQPEFVGEDIGNLGFEEIQRDSFPEMIRKSQSSVHPVTKMVRGVGKGQADVPYPGTVLSRMRSVPSTDTLLKDGVKPVSPIVEATNDQWFQIVDSKYTELEGAIMDHSVGGYSKPGNSYNIGGKEAFDSGQARVFSLRDATTGEPKITVDVDYSDPENPYVYMFKGPSNTEELGEDYAQLFKFVTENDITLLRGTSREVRDAYDQYRADLPGTFVDVPTEDLTLGQRQAWLDTPDDN